MDEVSGPVSPVGRGGFGNLLRWIYVTLYWTSRKKSSTESRTALRSDCAIDSHQSFGTFTGADADSHFTLALALLEPVSAFEAARTRLSWGESLRRRRQRGQARKLLDQALAAFTKLGAVTWAAQTATELETSGTAVHRTIPAPASQLTPREFQICTFVAQGATNPEIAAKLFLSRKTIEAHLGRIFAKLGVRSRTELTRLVIQNGLGERGEGTA